jgi:hypothetical protein
MSQQAAPYSTHPADYPGRDWGGPRYVSRPFGLWFLGLAAVALVVVAGVYFAPDFQRYMKIRRM